MDYQLTEQIQRRPVAKLLKQTDDVVISGIGGRFPLSESLDEFANNLYSNIDMVTEDENNERWPKGKIYENI